MDFRPLGLRLRGDDRVFRRMFQHVHALFRLDRSVSERTNERAVAFLLRASSRFASQVYRGDEILLDDDDQLEADLHRDRQRLCSRALLDGSTTRRLVVV